MVGVSCLFKDTILRRDLGDLVSFIAYDLAEKGVNANVGSVFNIIRESGIEVDLQTVGHIYNDVMPQGVKEFDSMDEVNAFVQKHYHDSIRRAALLEQPEEQYKQLGQDSPGIEVVKSIMNIFYKANTDPNSEIFSDLRQMQEALWKGVKRKLNLDEYKKPVDQKGWEELLTKAMSYENLGMMDMNGNINGIADLFDEMQNNLDEAMNKFSAQADFATVQKMNDMVRAIRSSAYSYLFSKGEAKDFITTIFNDAGFGKKTKSGKIIIDWNKLANGNNNIQDLRQNVSDVMEAKGYSPNVIAGVMDSFEEDFTDLSTKMLEYKTDKLDSKTANIGKGSNKKTDLRRLAELNNLGIFESAHDKLLNKTLGISGIQQDDFEDLKKIAQAASDLFKHIDKNYGNEVFASFAFQQLQHKIDNIVSRNINNKTGLLKTFTVLKNFVDTMLTGLLMGPLTIAQNFITGTKELGSPVFGGKAKFNKADRALYAATLFDITKGGTSFGEEVGAFAPRELYTQSLKFKWKDANKKELSESMLYLLLTPARIGLMGFDSANKAVITNKVFYNAMFTGLTQSKQKDGVGMTDEEATNFLSEMLNGKMLDAKTDAEKLLNQINLTLPANAQISINNNTITRLANDLVKANLTSNAAVTTDMISAMVKGSYHVAGYGLGHEPNNIVSRGIKSLRNEMSKNETSLKQTKQWNKLAWNRFINTIINGGVLKFTGGATNWIWLELQSGFPVLGLAWGAVGKAHYGNDVDFTSKDTIKTSIKDMQIARSQQGRALVGTTYALAGYLLYYMVTAGGDDDRKKNKERAAYLKQKKDNKTITASEIEELVEVEKHSSVMKQIKSNYEGNRLFKKVAPQIMLMQYFMDTDDDTFTGVLDYAQATSGLGSDFSTSQKILDARQYAKNGETDMANGKMASIAGESMSVPLWRSYKEWFKLANWMTGGNVSSDWKNPSNFTEGIIGGGFLEDIGAYSRNSGITILPGIGPKSVEEFKKFGITKMSDIKDNPGWYNLQYRDEDGDMRFILDKTTRANVEKAAEKWFKEND